MKSKAQAWSVFARAVRTASALSWLLAWTSGLSAATPAESLGWRIGPAAWSFNRFTFFEAIDKTSALGLHYIEAFTGQRLGTGDSATMSVDLPAAAITKIAAKLDSAQVKLISIYIHSLPGEEKSCRQAFEFCRKLGIETIVSEPDPEALNVIEKLCDEYNIKVAIHNHPKGSSRYWHPQEVLKVCEGRSPRLGACADIGHWQRSGIKPVDGVRLLGSRLLSLNAKDLTELNPNGHDVPWGTGRGEIAAMLREIQRQGLKPTIFAIEYEYNWDNNSADIARCAEFFTQTVANLVAVKAAQEGLLLAGWATTDITPPKPVALVGQLHKRISTGVRDPLTATVLAMESRRENVQEQAVMVSCDLLFMLQAVQQRLQERLKERIPGLDTRKVILNATHTHTGPGLSDSTFGDLYDVSKDVGVMKASEYADHFIDRLVPAVVEAWQNRRPASVSWALGHAEISSNRRVRYFDGTAVMYGNTSATNFSNLEGSEDHALKLLCFWAPGGKLSGLIINLPCTAQETEQLYEVSADFWHETRQELRHRFGDSVFVLAQCSSAGDLSPHSVYRKTAEQIMDQRRGLSRRQEIARRIVNAVEEAMPVARGFARDKIVFRHTVAQAILPSRQPPAQPFYETDSIKPIEFHVLRLDDVAIATCPFELYLDYGIRIEARSAAPLTMLVQLAGGASGYLPTTKAVQGGGYSADKFAVGPEGGQVLVEETVRHINELFP